MEYLLMPKNIKVLETFAMSNSIFGFDFDGTLAPIVMKPELASMSKNAQLSLKKLCALVPVAIITGRSVADVRSFLDFEPKYVIGNHGVEGTQGGKELYEIESKCNHLKKHLEKSFSTQMSHLGIILEDKKYSLTLHYRNCDDIPKAEEFLTHSLRNLPQGIASKGKMVFNISPEKSTNKGQAFLSVLSNESAAFGFYIGDDVTDETVFLHQDPKILKIRVGHSSASAAQYYLNDQSEIDVLLELLVDFVSRKQSIG